MVSNSDMDKMENSGKPPKQNIDVQTDEGMDEALVTSSSSSTSASSESQEGGKSFID